MPVCEKCMTSGITCYEPNGVAKFFNVFGEVRLNGKVVLNTNEKIAACPIVTGALSQEEIVNKILKNVQDSKTMIVLGEPRNADMNL